MLMSHRYTPLEIINAPKLLTANSRLVALGSCFSDHMGGRLAHCGFRTETNPVGILYNPVSLATSIGRAMAGTGLAPDNVHERDGLFFHYDYHSDMSATSAAETVDTINNASQQLSAAIGTADCMLITLGTAIAYRHKDTQEVVANCHKMPSQLFEKELLSVEDMYSSLYNSIADTKVPYVVLTVSPVRHTKEGLVHNQRSKARLIETAHQLAHDLEHVYYFPSYELMMDELRDYRYYKQDMIHPTAEAVDIIWTRFIQTYMDGSAREKVKEVDAVWARVSHRPMHAGSKAHAKFVQQTQELIAQVLEKYPDLPSSFFQRRQ